MNVYGHRTERPVGRGAAAGGCDRTCGLGLLADRRNGAGSRRARSLPGKLGPGGSPGDAAVLEMRKRPRCSSMHQALSAGTPILRPALVPVPLNGLGPDIAQQVPRVIRCQLNPMAARR